MCECVAFVAGLPELNGSLGVARNGESAFSSNFRANQSICAFQHGLNDCTDTLLQFFVLLDNPTIHYENGHASVRKEPSILWIANHDDDDDGQESASLSVSASSRDDGG